MSDLATQWRGGEGAIGRDRALERAAEQLPPRLGLLLRAIAALHGGSRRAVAQVAATARAAGDIDVATILDVALADPAELDPTALRKRAKAEGADSNARFAVLDLIRAFAVHRSGGPAGGSPALRADAKARPMLQAVVEMLTTQAETASVSDACDAAFPRAAQVVVAARAVRYYGRMEPGAVTRTFGRDLLHADAWMRAEDDGRATILNRLGGAPWTHTHDAASEWLYARPPAERRAWLGPLLRALDGRVRKARIGEAQVLAHAAGHLAAGDDVLLRQLGLVENQLAWIAAGAEAQPEVAEAIWVSRPRLGADERLVLARLLVSFDADAAPDVARAAGAHVAAFGRAENDVALGVTMLLEEGVSPAAWLQRAGAPAGRVAVAEAYVAACEQRDELALRAVPAICAGGDGGHVAWALGELAILKAGPAHTAAAQAVAGLADDLDALNGLAVLARAGLPAEARARVMACLEAAAPEVVGRAIAIAAAIGERDAAQGRVAEEGRRLRGAPDADARAATLVAGAFGEAAAPPAAAVEVVRPLVQFLLRGGPGPALRALSAVPRRLDVGALTFCLLNAEALERDVSWPGVVARLLTRGELSDPGRFPQLLKQARPRSVRAALALLDEQLDDADDDIVFGAS